MWSIRARPAVVSHRRIPSVVPPLTHEENGMAETILGLGVLTVFCIVLIALFQKLTN